MRTHTTEGEEIAYRNFNLCPHCEAQGEPATLCRMRESLPMISRSDGETFHLVLADRPRPYPNERSAGTTHEVSVCFWYSHLNDADETHSTIVILPASDSNCPTLFRTIETVADLLAAELGRHRQLAEFYEFFQSSVDPEDRRPS